MNIPLQDNTLNSKYLLEEFSINFIGKELFYSEQTIESVQSEFGVSTHRFESIASLPIYESENNGPGRILIVDQMLTEDFLARPQHYKDSAGLGSLVFAYRKEDAARFVFDRWDPGAHGDIGYLPMNIAPDAWRSILRLLLHEELYLPSFLANSVCNTTTPTQKHSVESTDPHPLYSKLTRREKQVLRLVSKGQSNKIIASNLGITEHTVKLHIHNVAGKIGVSNRTAAAQFFLRSPRKRRSTRQLTEDFEARFDRLILLVGRLNYMWTNTESLLIHLIAGLSGTPKDTAVIIFLTLNTTRARIDLVERLAKMEGRPAEIRDPILEHTHRLSKLSGIRNRYNHCIYSFDPDSGNPKTILMRIADRKTDIRLGREDTVDDEAMREIEKVVTQLSEANRDIWRLIGQLGFPV